MAVVQHLKLIGLEQHIFCLDHSPKSTWHRRQRLATFFEVVATLISRSPCVLDRSDACLGVAPRTVCLPRPGLPGCGIPNLTPAARDGPFYKRQ
ncbi:hypothetical protein E2C01_040443 [Portunus trituberculatus]|uniref:Uncharacterized protein n=1 Tax=Portunus trituberculatus TaxID=210409 RepID=A0A5B7FN06_PORTR|nr:hypothetical protein [Portunus trituberculatus]